MPTRREFLKNVSGTAMSVLFTGCCCAESSFGSALKPAQSGAQSTANRKRREVFVGGQRANVVEKHLADLNEMGIDVQAVSVNPFWYWADVDLSRKIIQIQNEKIAEFCAAHPKRLA